MARIELSWGGGSFDTLVDLRTGEVLSYGARNGYTDLCHEDYGGRCYYISRSGFSGAGWVPARPWLKLINAYRVDVSTGNMFGHHNPLTVAGKAVYAPIDFQGSVLPNDYPVVVDDHGVAVMLRRDEVVAFLAGEMDELDDRDVEITFIATADSEPETKTYPVKVTRRHNFGGTLRVVEGLHHADLAFQWPESASSHTTIDFWKRLGLHLMGSSFFKVSGGVARKRYTREELSTVERLQAASPASACVLTPNLYLQERGDSYVAAGLFTIDGEEWDYEEYITSEEAIRAMQGNFPKVVTRLEEGARRKAVQQAEYRRRQEQLATERAERDQKFRELCEQHADTELTIEDSLAAGNCRPGTENFRDRFFPERERVTVGELIRCLSVAGVRRVLECKLLPLAEQNGVE